MTAENQQPIDNQEEMNTQENNEQQAAAEQTEQTNAEETQAEETQTEEVSEADALRAELAEQKDKYLRQAAEYDNYRKRTMKEKAELILTANRKCLEGILPVVDDMERALSNMANATDVEAVRKGVELIYNKFISVLEQDGVKKIEAIGQPLDTDSHEAIAVIPAPTEEQKGKVIDCVQTGYTLNGTILRHAKVVVGQ